MRTFFKEFLILVLIFSLVSCGGNKNLQTQESTTVPDTSSLPSKVNPLKIVGQIGGLTKAIAVQGNFAYVGVGYRLMILDVTDPSNPQEIGASQPFDGQILDIAVSENYAYLSTGKSGLYIVNISDPSQPAVVGQYDTPGYAEGVIVQKDNAFIADGPGGMSIINILDPAKPTLESASYTKNYIYDIVLDQSYAYLAAAGAGLLVADITDRTHPIETGSFDTPGYAYGITAIGSTLYIADGWEGLQVLDVSDPGQPKDIGAIQTQGWAMDLTSTNNSLYIADAFGGLCVLDISNKEAPKKIGSLEIPDGHAAKVAANGNIIYLADTKSGVHIIDVTKQDQPIIVSSYTPMGYVQAVTVADGYAYAAAQNSGFRVINVMDPTQPREVATIPLAGPAVSIAQSGTTAYVADYEFLNTVDLTDPSQPKVTSSERMKGTKNIETLNSGSFLSDEIVGLVSRSLTIQGTTLFLAGEWGLLLLDITNPLLPQELGFLQTTDSPYSQQEPVAIGVAVYENTAYLAVCGAGLYVVDISIPDHPTLISAFNEPMPTAYGKMNASINVMDVVVAPPYAYILDQNAVRIIDISDSKNPKGLGIYALPTMPFNNGGGASRSLAIEGSRLFVVDNAAGLLVLDVTDPTAPKLDSELHLPGIASWVFVENGYVYVASGEGGLFIIQYTQNASGPSENATPVVDVVPEKTGNTSPAIQTKTIKSIFTPYEEVSLPVTNAITSGKTIIVSSVADSGTGTLRDSLERVNSGDIITFDPQVFPPENPSTIRINSQLPTISKDGITIDASNAGVILDGSDAPSGTAGLSIGSNNNSIMGLQILNFLSDGIKLSGSNNTIGGDREKGNGLMGEGNLVSGNRDFGISVCCGENAVNNLIVGNYIGTDVTGTKALANGVGIVLGGWNNTIGGETPAERNVISGNFSADIEIKLAAENLIIGNYIGLDKNGLYQISKSAGFSFSIWLKSFNNRIERNVIAGTLGFVDPGTSYNVVVGNYFGTDATGLVSLNSDSYVVVSQPFNHIGGTNTGEGNLINGRIYIARTSNTLVLGNSINTDITGKSVFPRTGGWEVDLAEGSCYNFIGGTTDAERNVINGGQESVLVHLETYSNFNFIAGNSIGSDSSGTLVFPNQTGIAVEDAEFNFIQSNLITGAQNGISLSLSDYEKPGANFNTIKMNDIVQNSKFGIGIGKGDSNTIFGNLFSTNGNNGYDVGNNNHWDDGSFGNYWSDYTGKDANADGIGDTPYIIPKNGIDNRPMINLSK